MLVLFVRIARCAHHKSHTLCFALNFQARQGISRAIVRYIGREILWRAGKNKAKGGIRALRFGVSDPLTMIGGSSRN